MNRECVNCPGATDHDTAHCPMKPQPSAAPSSDGVHPTPETARAIAAYVRDERILEKVSAAQSAPDEREAFEQHASDRKLELCKVTPCDGSPPRYDAAASEWVSFQAGAAWQRAQSAPVSDAPSSDDYAQAIKALDAMDWSGVALGTKVVLGRVRDLLWHAQHAQSAPVVPELTGAMVEAAWRSVAYKHENGDSPTTFGDLIRHHGRGPLRTALRAALAAAPQPGEG